MHSLREYGTFMASLLQSLTSLALALDPQSDEDPPRTGTILSDKGAQNLFNYIQQGGNFAGIHS